MGQRGPRKKPAAAKRAAGTYREDRDGGVEVRPALPDPPAWLGAIATAEWHRRGPQLAEAGLVSPLDQVAFSLWCQSYEQFVLSYQHLAGLGEFTTETDNGNVIQHPVVSVLHKARSDLVKIGREFGMTPSARSGLRPAGGAEDPSDPLDEMARRRQEYERQQQSESSPRSAPETSASPKPKKARKGTAGKTAGSSRANGNKKTARKKTAAKKKATTAKKKTATKKKAAKKKKRATSTRRPKSGG